ncbi:MAG: antiterminator LoaP [Clostridiales bacterium]|nr:antiterminator LoaP [Clostridiales bacterium]
MYSKQYSNDWYAVFVVTGAEDKVKERLEYRFGTDIRVLVPKRRLRERKNGKWHHTIRTLFPGYILLNGSMGVKEYYKLKGVPELLKLLRTGNDFAKIELNDIEVIGRLICNNEVIGISDVLVENGRVIVVDGPLISLEGQIININHRKGRARVRLNFLGESRTVELGISVLQPATMIEELPVTS